jgi:hypothetical protein
MFQIIIRNPTSRNSKVKDKRVDEYRPEHSFLSKIFQIISTYLSIKDLRLVKLSIPLDAPNIQDEASPDPLVCNLERMLYGQPG